MNYRINDISSICHLSMRDFQPCDKYEVTVDIILPNTDKKGSTIKSIRVIKDTKEECEALQKEWYRSGVYESKTREIKVTWGRKDATRKPTF